jgi:hypothetical protein
LNELLQLQSSQNRGHGGNAKIKEGLDAGLGMMRYETPANLSKARAAAYLLLLFSCCDKLQPKLLY